MTAPSEDIPVTAARSRTSRRPGGADPGTPRLAVENLRI